MPIAYIIGKFRPTRLPTPLKLGKHRLTARFTNYILHQFNSFSGYSFLDSSFLFFSSSSSESGCSSALGKFHPRDPTPWSPSTVVSGQNLNAGHFLHPAANHLGLSFWLGRQILYRKFRVFQPTRYVGGTYVIQLYQRQTSNSLHNMVMNMWHNQFLIFAIFIECFFNAS